MMNIPLHIGKAPDKTAFTMNEQDDYYQLVAELPKLHEQGDGMFWNGRYIKRWRQGVFLQSVGQAFSGGKE